MELSIAKLVILEIHNGSFSQGFDIVARIIVDRRSEQIFKAKLPPAPHLPHLYDQWQASYRALGQSTLISVSTTQITNLSIIGDCTQLSDDLKQNFNQWLNSDSIRTLERSLLIALGPSSDRIRFMVQTDDRYLRRLPWQTWDLFEQHYPSSEVMLSHPITPRSAPLNSPVRILAIEGNTDGTEATLDLTQLNRLPQTHITVLRQPTASELIDRLWHEDWDMFFFIGHSDSTDDDQNGKILLNATEAVTLSEIHHALKNALKNGLKLAIFNSCNGLGLAQRLADLNIPYVIVMRERVPDQVALEFFKTFLTTFSQGKVLHSALHTARQKLLGYSDRYPCAHWLPVLCQNPNAPELQYPKAKKTYQWAIAASLSAALAIGFLPMLLNWYMQEQSFQARSSSGENLLDRTIKNEHKLAGIKAFSKGDFDRAKIAFTESLTQQPNDPETRIYLSNLNLVQPQNKVRIVVSVPLNTSPFVAREILRGVAQRQYEYNQNRTNQMPGLEIIIGSDDNNEKITKNLAPRWAQNPNIVAVVGHNAGNASLPASKIYEEAKMPMISPTTYVTDSQDAKYTFRMQPNTFPVAQLLAQYANQNFVGQTMAGCVDSESHDNRSFEGNLKGIMSKGQVKYLPDLCTIANNINPDEEIQALQRKGVKVIVIAPFVNELDRSAAVARAARRAGIKVLGTPSFYNQETLNKPMMAGIIFPVSWMPHLPKSQLTSFLPETIRTSENAQFYQRALSLWKIPTLRYEPSITWRTAMAYDSTGVITNMLSASNTIDRTTITNQLQSGKLLLEGVTGNVRFDSRGDRIGLDQGVMVTVQSDGSPGKLEFVPIAVQRATVPQK